MSVGRNSGPLVVVMVMMVMVPTYTETILRSCYALILDPAYFCILFPLATRGPLLRPSDMASVLFFAPCLCCVSEQKCQRKELYF